MIEIRPVRSSRDWELFIGLPWSLYSGDSNWVPQLRIAVRDMLDVRKNPFFKHAFMNPWVALREGEVVGRIVGVIDENHNRFHGEKTAFFGFFEAVDDPGVARRLNPSGLSSTTSTPRTGSPPRRMVSRVSGACLRALVMPSCTIR